MTDPRDDDAVKLAELARELPTIDLDPASAARVVRVARQGAGLMRYVEPVLAAAFVTSYLAWAISKVLEALG
ncbi:MAG: hypothetical protein H7138_03560 [Myxococcales bacterium]|nr:hypothetical protein [Myxococcales bacterium]